MDIVFLRRGNRPRHHRQPRRRARTRRLVTLASLLVFIAGLVALSAVAANTRAAAVLTPPAPPPIEIAQPAREPRLPVRPVFRHSVIPGGAYSSDEVEEVMARDGVVAAHYSGVNARALRVETLPADRDVYMSYRIGQEILWTKQKVRVPKGETILTDGVHHIRARCGNCIAFAPMAPTADDEPSEREFDALTDDADLIPSHMPLGVDLLRPYASIPLPWLLGYSSDAIAGNSAMGGGRSFGMPLYGYATNLHEPQFLSEVSDMVLFPLTDVDPPVNDAEAVNDFPPVSVPTTHGLRDDHQDPDDPGDPGDPGISAHPGDPGDPFDPNVLVLENPIVPAPEPATLLLVGGGLATMVARRRRRR